MAVHELETLGVLRRFDGRGFVVSGAQTPKRTALTHEMLGLSKVSLQLPQQMASQRIATDFEASIA